MVSALAPSGGAPWLLGGDTVTPDGITHAAVWSAAGTAGPWSPVPMDAVPGRDGPNETMLGLASGAAGRGPLVALGSRHSPTEGYPRPSPWVAGPGRPVRFQELLYSRELFGGPNIVLIGEASGGGLTSGPHGYFVAGAWTGPADQAVACVWSAPPAGSPWSRNATDAAFRPPADAQSYGTDAADGPLGVLMVGYNATPTPADPTGETGALWYSPDGARWTRLPPVVSGPRTTLAAVRDVAGGWLAGGARSVDGRFEPAVWLIGPSGAPSLMPLPAPAAGGVVDDLAVTGTRAYAAGLSAGRPVLWSAPLAGGRLGRWRVEATPPAGAGWDQVRVAASGPDVVLIVFNGGTSQVWRRGG